MIELLKSLLFGIVQGITEWLPVSSTGHMILLEELIKLDVSEDFWNMFLVVIQFGSILAVVFLYFSKLNPFSRKKTPVQRTDTWKLWLKVLIAVIPSAIFGLLFDDWIDAHFFNYITVAIALIVYGVAFILIERRKTGKHEIRTELDNLDYRTAFFIGVFQVLALIPGTSRSGSTILGAMLLGLTRTAAAEFSFFMAIPTMLGASGLKILKYVMGGNSFSGQELSILLVGLVTAFVVSLFAIKALIRYVRNHSFSGFGVYRIILGLALIAYTVVTMLVQ